MSALNWNRTELCGRLTADVELKQTQSGLSVVTFTIAVNRPRAKDSTEQKSDFISCVAWDKRAEFIAKYFGKGDSIFISGKLQTRNYKARDGHTVYITEVVIDEAQFVDSKAAADPTERENPVKAVLGGGAADFEEISPDDQDLPF